jgi:hypothetical protein
MRTSLPNRCATATLCLLAFSWASRLQAAYLEGDTDSRNAGDRDAHRPPPSERILPRPPEDGHPLRRLLGRLEVGEPVSYGGLTLYPLRGARGSDEDLRTLDEAAGRDWLDIREAKSAEVGSVDVRNRSRRNVFLMAGEIILGGKQNRFLREDVLLGPDGPFLRVPVYCGERERWTDKPDPVFRSAGSMGDVRLRHMSARAEPQSEVWTTISERLSDSGAEAPTRNYQAVYEDRDTRRRLDDYVAGLRGCKGRDTLGLVGVSGGRIVGCDAFSDPELLDRLWDKICRSYAVEPVLQYRDHDRDARRPWPPGLDREDIRVFLRAAALADFEDTGTPGEGRRIEVRGAAEGQALIWRGEAVHAALFPTSWHPEPTPPPRPWPRPPIVPMPYEEREGPR